jgi:hypothetical protein
MALLEGQPPAFKAAGAGAELSEGADLRPQPGVTASRNMSESDADVARGFILFDTLDSDRSLRPGVPVGKRKPPTTRADGNPVRRPLTGC